MTSSASQLKGIVDPLLTNVSSAYIPDGCIADTLFPALKFSQYTGKLGAYGKNHLRIENTITGGKGKYRRAESIVRKTSSFEIEGHGLSGLVTKSDYKNVIDPFDAEKDEVMGLSTILLLEKEKGLADALTATGTMTQNTTLSGTSQLSDYLNSDVVSVINTGKKAIRDNSGSIANCAIMDYYVAQILRYHPQLLDMLGFKWAKPGGLADDELAKALGIDNIYIPNCVYNSANEGATDVLASVWGKHIVLAQIPKSAAKYQISLGYNIRLDDGSPRKVYKQPIFNPPGSTEILVEDEYDMFLSDVTAGYLIANAVA
jgi:hypothetical protein